MKGRRDGILVPAARMMRENGMTKFPTIALTLLLAGAVTPLAAQTPPPPPPAEAMQKAAPYVLAAGKGDLYEIGSSEIAVQKSGDPAVRRYAEMLIRHHRQTTAATLAAARQAGVTPPPVAIDAGARAAIEELRRAPAADFDRLYLGQQVPAHRAALALHQGYGKSGDKPALRASAMKAVPIVREHLAAAETMQAGKPGHAGH
jgi:putative membrane protein